MKVTFKIQGTEKSVELNPGERLLKGIYKLGLDELGMGECGGNCVCCTCHVYVVEGADKFPPASEEEETMLDTAFNLQANSRLACQLVVQPDQEAVTVQVPE
ncbi:MAG: 2Fe-2S iron-sulfur cluster binding domain-containing protein [Proteobacteria bacterium]|nr:2Fe-2S iron-sulfur cluster binding domain-containing protein [Pseudomonadota bacterium]